MNGKEQTTALAKLAGYKPDQLGGIRVGDLARLPNVDAALEVIDLADPLLILRAPSGHELKAGWRTVTRIRTRSEITQEER